MSNTLRGQIHKVKKRWNFEDLHNNYFTKKNEIIRAVVAGQILTQPPDFVSVGHLQAQAVGEFGRFSQFFLIADVLESYNSFLDEKLSFSRKLSEGGHFVSSVIYMRFSSHPMHITRMGKIWRRELRRRKEKK